MDNIPFETSEKFVSIQNWLERIEQAEEKLRHGTDGGGMEFYNAEIPRLKGEIANYRDQLRALVKYLSQPLVSDRQRVEIIMLITDNDRLEALESIRGIFRTKHPFKLTVYENTLNTMNTSKIWNKLVKQSTCGYVLIIDSDAFPRTDGWLEEMVKVLERYPDVAVVCPVAGNTAVTTVQRIQSKPMDEFHINGHISGYCMLFKKEIFDTIGFFDEDFCFYGQDSDWVERVLENGEYKIFVVPRSLVEHGTDTVGSTSSRRMEEAGKFNRMVDSEFAKWLFEFKKEERKKSKQ